ncbi:MAG: aspartate/glutamate racemase family protein, partial [Alphaproteobacteria bacterium]
SPRVRIGCIVPAINVVAEDDFIALGPPQAGVHFARADVDRTRDLASQFQQMVDDAPRLAAVLAKAGVAVVAFACTSASFFRGPGADRALDEAMSARAGVPAVSTATAVVEALRALGVGRIAVATPYVQWVYEAEEAFLTAAGFGVLAINGLGLEGGRAISSLPGDEIRRLAADVDRPEAEALFISCTDLPALAHIERLEREHGKPVVTSNQATFWAAARTAGLGPIPGYGQLLARFL